MIIQPTLSRHDERLMLNACCIDAVHGGVYAWLYLSQAGLKEHDILRLLATPDHLWRPWVDNTDTTALLAMSAAGIWPPRHAEPAA